MRKGISRPLTAEQEAELKALAAVHDQEIDTSGMPEIVEWSGARRGVFYRPTK
jgi:hypothetical protein